MKNMRIILRKKYRWKLKHIDEVLLLALAFVTSWAYIMPTSYFDEIFLVLLFGYILVTHKKLDNNLLKIILCYVIWCLLGLIMNMKMNLYSLIQLIDSLKPIIMLLCISAIKIDEEKTDSILHIFELINIPSIGVGIINAVRYNYLHMELLIDTGTLKIINGTIVERAGGLIGHSGVFSEVCAVLFIIVLFHEKTGTKKILKMAFYLIGLYCGRGRFPLVIAVAAIFWYFWKKISSQNKKYLFWIIIFTVVGLAYPIYLHVSDLFALDFQNQIRFVALRSVMKLLKDVLMFGVGIGNLGNSGSITNNYDLYRQLNMIGFGDVDWESQLAKSLLQTGLIGTILWYCPFILYFYKIYTKKRQDKYKNLTSFLLGYYIVNSFINKSYTLPFLVVLCVVISVELNE